MINFHAWGNLFIHPFNFEPIGNKLLIHNYPKAKAFYEDIWTNGNLPYGNIEGNGAKAIKYTANGEASDYILGVQERYALSPELGDNTARSEHFFIKDSKTLKRVLEENFNWVELCISKLRPII